MNEPFKPEIYAIDFGTSNSLLAAANATRVWQPVGLDVAAADPTIFRSILFFSEESRWSFGAQALTDYVASGMRGRFMRSIKRFLPVQSFDSTLLGTRRVRLEELVGVFLRELRTRANQHFGADVTRALLGRPARFSDDPEADALAEQRLRRAAEFAGFTRIDFCPEPVAAAYAFREELRGKSTVLVADFGGGTSDYTVMQLDPEDESASSVLSMGGISLAGDALDGVIMRSRIAHHFGANVSYQVPFGSNVLRMPRSLVDRLSGPADLCLLERRDVRAFLNDVRSWSLGPDDRAALDQLMILVDDSLGFQIFESVERVKRELSSAASAEFRFSYPGIDVAQVITRAEFESDSAPVSTSILERLDSTLAAGNLRYDDIDWVCCTGGTAKVPAIANGVRERFGAERLREFASFHGVIAGLAARARTLVANEH